MVLSYCCIYCRFPIKRWKRCDSGSFRKILGISDKQCVSVRLLIPPIDRAKLELSNHMTLCESARYGTPLLLIQRWVIAAIVQERHIGLIEMVLIRKHNGIIPTLLGNRIRNRLGYCVIKLLRLLPGEDDEVVHI